MNESMETTTAEAPRRKPEWLRVKLPGGGKYKQVRSIVDEHKLHTICQSGHCPNIAECWGAGSATFMILGNVCTRSCGFCNVATGRPEAPDPFEPARVSRSVELMGVKHCVITSVDRDDLADGGAAHIMQTVQRIKQKAPRILVEALVPDFSGSFPILFCLG